MQLVLRGRWRKVGNFCLQLNLQSILQRNATNNGRNWKRSDSQASDTICDMPWILPTYFKIFNGKPKYKISQNVIVLYQIFILIFNVFQGLYHHLCWPKYVFEAYLALSRRGSGKWSRYKSSREKNWYMPYALLHKNKIKSALYVKFYVKRLKSLNYFKWFFN